ncbi:hypothetical protein KIPB_011412, partial [Kipferlia bialata]|eukprot:g11412.t1
MTPSVGDRAPTPGDVTMKERDLGEERRISDTKMESVRQDLAEETRCRSTITSLLDSTKVCAAEEGVRKLAQIH